MKKSERKKKKLHKKNKELINKYIKRVEAPRMESYIKEVKGASLVVFTPKGKS